jgi:hypothetical protein
MGYYRPYFADEPVEMVEYHYCDIDPDKGACKVGKFKECGKKNGKNKVNPKCKHFKQRGRE